MRFPFGFQPIFRGVLVSFGECTSCIFGANVFSVPTSRIDLAGLAYGLGKDVVLQGPPLSLQGGPLTKVYKRPWVDEMSILYPDIRYFPESEDFIILV